MFIKHGDGKVVEIVPSEALTEEQKEKMKEVKKLQEELLEAEELKTFSPSKDHGDN